MARPVPDWVLTEWFTDVDLGVLKSGKEAEIRVVERSRRDGSGRHLLAQKRYRPRRVAYKGQLEELGFTRAATFRNDIGYREGRAPANSRDRRAVEKMSRHGKQVVAESWLGQEHDVLRSLWEVGAPVPFPVSFDDHGGLFLEYLGDDQGAAPRLAQARLSPPELRRAWDQLVEAMFLMVDAGWVHADLSAYNLLWWADRLWVIDVPQAVDLVGSTQGFELLHRDVVNVCGWFARHGLEVDAEVVFAELLGRIG
ncbi:MAG: hypothetical protein H0W25_09240 [Acidimicrobiia bacterium]|nr:hypothetical protein [Acidimicrobiia bacterium]